MRKSKRKIDYKIMLQTDSTLVYLLVFYQFCLSAAAFTPLAVWSTLSFTAALASGDWLESLATSLLVSPVTACAASETFSAT